MNEGLKNWKTDWMNEWVERNECNEMSVTEKQEVTISTEIIEYIK